MAAPGHAFGPDTPWQRELEDAFPYVETPDQLGVHRRGQGRHGEAGPDGPADLRRRRLRQDRDRRARGVQGGAGRQAGRGAGADDAARAAAPLDVLRAVRAVPGDRQGRCRRFQTDKEAAEVAARPRRRHGRPRHRHPPAAVDRDPVQGPRPGHRRRGAAVRRRAQGAPQAAAHRRRRAGDVGDADPAHPGDGAHRHPGDVDDPHPAGGAAPGADVRRRRTTSKQIAAAIRRELLREGQVFFVHNRVRVDRPGRRAAARAGARGAGRDRARPDERARARAGHGRLLGEASTTSWSAPRSSSPASTSRTPTP